jgi:hypothetical protein
MDTMFLRDLGGLLDDEQIGQEFCYRWSATTDHANTAVVGLRAGGAAASAILQRCRDLGHCGNRLVLRFDENPHLDLLVLPCPFFDPLWPHRDRQDRYAKAPFDRFDGFFRRFGWLFRRDGAIGSYRDFFPGAYTYHWHNMWQAREHEESYFGMFDREFDSIVEARLGVRVTPAGAIGNPVA